MRTSAAPSPARRTQPPEGPPHPPPGGRGPTPHTHPRIRGDSRARAGWWGQARSGCTCAWAPARTRARGWAPARAPPSRARLQTQSGYRRCSHPADREQAERLGAQGTQPQSGWLQKQRAGTWGGHAGRPRPVPRTPREKARSTPQVKRSGNVHQRECELISSHSDKEAGPPVSRVRVTEGTCLGGHKRQQASATASLHLRLTSILASIRGDFR